MARQTPLTSLKQISEINLTPLMDLTFILLITFIITFPLMEQGIHVNLPHGEADDLSPEQSRTITVDAKGAIYLDNNEVLAEELERAMKALGEASPETQILVRADEAIKYGRIVKVLKILHDAKITKMALVTQADEG